MDTNIPRMHHQHAPSRYNYPKPCAYSLLHQGPSLKKGGGMKNYWPITVSILCSSCFFSLTVHSQGNEACLPLSEQYPELGTSQSISAKQEFKTTWGSHELPGGPCGYQSAEEHYGALMDASKSRGGPTEHTPNLSLIHI